MNLLEAQGGPIHVPPSKIRVVANSKAVHSSLAGIPLWLGDRNDITPHIPDFIALFETAANRRPRAREQEAQILLHAPISPGGA